jgi:hypothetical protein
MDKNNIEPGKHYAIREHPNDDLQHVKIVESVRSRKWRAEWIDPNPGLIDYVASCRGVNARLCSATNATPAPWH